MDDALHRKLDRMTWLLALNAVLLGALVFVQAPPGVREVLVPLLVLLGGAAAAVGVPALLATLASATGE
ncbi:hypothetical protein [Salinilacihabitans rarus]|uniref:hypothetical protein n=1 Tax=Salinilacihabitans rarus TaxID=2961596 RepID=UPI0020C93833|nr:hypothetical protein [Salinilacihabitans rarus]